ncbi:hypothetical protein FISHEDRAFT_52926 [Fistulina hepatica ATCC 64428]|nr:hypothetical protein FISHEDRAFT_52926 [Fistulina hepatica ATCC 64428]
MSSRLNLKRTADSTEASSSSKPNHAPKKTRFVEPEDDPVNFAEQVDSALEDPTARRKGRVKNEGYESDSSDDGEGVVFSRKKATQEDEDDDMFAVGDKPDDAMDEDVKEKQDAYMRLGDIEGQEFGDESKSDTLSEEEDEPEDEDDAERRKKAGMGYEMSSFNMREEMEEGKFTEDGSYIRSFDPHGVHDRWMEGVDEKEIKLARRRKKHMEKIQKEKMKAEERELAAIGGKHSIERELLPLLKKGETVLEALQRLGVSSKKAHKPSVSSTILLDDPHHIQDPADKATSHIETITHLAATLMSFGDTDIYSKTYEEFVRDVRKSGSVDETWEPPSADVKYDYKWASAALDQPEQVFGPYSEGEMKSWYQARYFGSVGEMIKVRPQGGEWADWDDVIL